MDNLYEKIQDSTAYISLQIPGLQPKIAIVLGSGLGHLVNELENPSKIPYSAIPNFISASVSGHSSVLYYGKLGGKNLAVLQGRLHFYEGHDMATITFPVRVMIALGVELLILTNAAGGINPGYKPGDLMGISDHIFLPGMAGYNPLRGPNDERLGLRFPPLTGAYTPELLDLAALEAKSLGISFHKGVYVMVSGPNYETPAELRYLRSIGGDAVGMSTAPEAVVAAHSGIKVLGISTITNLATGDVSEKTSHTEVLAVGLEVGTKLAVLLKSVISKL